MIQNFTIKSWAEDDRPREKMLLKGRHTLTDAEILAILLGSGSRDKSAVELAQEILIGSSNDLNQFGRKSISELMKFKGVGEAKAITIIAAFELGRRRKEIEAPERTKINSSKDIYDYLFSTFHDLYHEEFHVLFLNRRNLIIHKEQISKGGFAGTVVDGKVIFKKAFEHSASAIILCHNHPSGQLNPSDEDVRITSRLIKFGKMIDLPILDHIIFTDNGYFSFADKGMMI